MSVVGYINTNKTNSITPNPYQETTVKMDYKKSWKYWVKYYAIYGVIFTSIATIIFLIIFGLNNLVLRHIPRNINITGNETIYLGFEGLDFESQILLNSTNNSTTTENWDSWEEIKIFNKTVILNGTNTTIIINSNNFVPDNPSGRLQRARSLDPDRRAKDKDNSRPLVVSPSGRPLRARSTSNSPSLEKTIFKKVIPNLYSSH